MSEKNIDTGSEKITEKQTVDRRTYLKLAGAAGSGLGAGAGTGALGTEFTSPVRAASTVVDDFSDTDLNGRYKFNQRNATTGVTTVSTAVTSDADKNVLQMEGDGSTTMHAFQGDDDTDLNAYPEIGDTFSCWIRELNGTGTMNFIYGAKDANNKYYVQLNLTNAHLGLFKYVNGSGDSLAGDWSNSTIENNTGWFKVEIEWTTDHQHTVTLYQNGSQVTSFSTTDDSGDPFTANGVGFAGHLDTTSETTQFDYATTTGSSSTETTYTPKGLAPIDRFEDGSLESSTYDFDRGEDGASIVDTPTFGGSSKALKFSGYDTEMISTSGLPNYPLAGSTIRYRVRVEAGSERMNVTYGVQSHTDRYYVQFDWGNGYVILWKYKNGDGTTLASDTSISPTPDTWYQIKVDWRSDGTQIVTVFEEDGTLYGGVGTQLTQISGSDAEWLDGGIGYDAYCDAFSGTVYVDSVVKYVTDSC